MKTEQFFWKLSGCACAILLAACGSGGGEKPSTSSNNTQTQPTANNSSKTQNTQQSPTSDTQTVGNNNASNTPNNTANPVTTGMSSSGNFVGVSASLIAYRNTDKFITFGATSGAGGTSLDKVVIDGREITLTGNHFGQRGNGFQQTSNEGGATTVHTGYSYTRFGRSQIIQNDKETENVFGYGELTALNDMPTNGTAKYVGHALYGHKNSDGWSSNAKSQFDVNYGARKITGQITDPKLPTVHVEGSILANGFAGVKNGVQMQGRFFGPQAAELGGTFHKGIDDASAELMGSFGAKKQ